MNESLNTILTENDNGDIIFYNVKDIQKIFNCGINQAYALMHTDGFPSIKLNSKMIVSKEKLLKWIDKNSGRSIKI